MDHSSFSAQEVAHILHTLFIAEEDRVRGLGTVLRIAILELLTTVLPLVLPSSSAFVPVLCVMQKVEMRSFEMHSLHGERGLNVAKLGGARDSAKKARRQLAHSFSREPFLTFLTFGWRYHSCPSRPR